MYSLPALPTAAPRSDHDRIAECRRHRLRPHLERNAAGEAQSTPVITLLASPDDAERLTLASSEGHIQLALRNPLDTHQEDVAAANARGLYKGGTPAAAPPPVHVHPVKTTKGSTTDSPSFGV
jgi:Flp pilus assembly protein CpaB